MSAQPPARVHALREALGSIDLELWRAAARRLLDDGVPPESVVWVDPDDPQARLPSAPELPGPGVTATSRPGAGRVPRAFLELARLALCHRDPAKWDVLYRLLWRLTHHEARILSDATDPGTHALHQLVKAVKRDVHKMKAFVRFRRVERHASDGRIVEHYIAWHRPDHRIVRLVAPFFARRFGVMHWTILTPVGSATWDGEHLSHGPPAARRDAPAPDTLEDMWRTYYASVFNPARVNVRAMQREMPVRHWSTLPEATIIDELLRKAPRRVGTMLDARVGGGLQAEEFVPKGVELSIPVLREAVQSCRGCPLWERATQPVFGEGSGRASIVLVGEQPGDQEDRAGRPFVGPAGEVLDRALADAELKRAELYVTNAVKHFKWTPDPRGKRRIHSKPSVLEARACRAWLEHELALVRPRVVVLLGATAGQSVLGPGFRVGVSRGRVLDATALAPMLVVATVHPSAILRTPDEQAKAVAFENIVADLRLAKHAAGAAESAVDIG